MQPGTAPDPGEITQLLRRVSAGDSGADELLVSRVYAELRKIARNYLRSERRGHTLQPTALVHEAYLRLTRSELPPFKDRIHFFAVAAQAMRRILVDYARARMSAKRGAGVPVPFELCERVSPVSEDFLPPLDDALRRLAVVSPRQSLVVELRFFGGLTEDEIADFLGVTSRTVKRDWAAARAWLHSELGG